MLQKLFDRPDYTSITNEISDVEIGNFTEVDGDAKTDDNIVNFCKIAVADGQIYASPTQEITKNYKNRICCNMLELLLRCCCCQIPIENMFGKQSTNELLDLFNMTVALAQKIEFKKIETDVELQPIPNKFSLVGHRSPYDFVNKDIIEDKIYPSQAVAQGPNYLLVGTFDNKSYLIRKLKLWEAIYVQIYNLYHSYRYAITIA